MDAFENLIRVEAGMFALEAVRLTGLIVAAPLSWSSAPNRVKAGLVLLLTFAAHGHGALNPEVSATIGRIALGVGSEFMLGAAIGLIVRLVVGSVEIAAEQIALMMGLGIAQIFDPQVQGTHNVLSGLFRNFALLIAVAVGLHRVVIGATIGSFRVLPVGSLVRLDAYGPTFMALGSMVLDTGVRLAMPVIAVLFMTQVALAFISRAAPTMQVFSVGFAVTLGVGAMVILITLPDLGYEIASDMSQVLDRVETLVASAVESTQ